MTLAPPPLLRPPLRPPRAPFRPARWVLSVLLATLGLAPRGLADELRYGAGGAVLTAGGLLAWKAPGRLFDVPACRWCEENGFDRRLQGTSREMRPWADHASYATLAGSVALAFSAVRSPSGSEMRRNAGALLNSAAAAVIVTQAAKYGLRRARPYTHAPGWQPGGKDDERLSFFSGHTSIAVSLAVSALTVNDLRGQRRRRGEGWTAVGLAAATGVLRVRSNKHYASDVLAGAAVGWLAGSQVPRWFKAARRSSTAGALASPPVAGVPLGVPVASGALSRGTSAAKAWSVSAGRRHVGFSLSW